MTPRPEIPPILLTLIEMGFGRVCSKLQLGLIGREQRFVAVDQLNTIKNAVMDGEGAIPYLAELGLTPDGGPPEEMRLIVELLEGVQALADWQLNKPPLVDASTVREFFLRIGNTSPWKTPAEINFRDGNVSPAAQRLIRALSRFRTSEFGGCMVMITPLIGISGAVISAWIATGPTDVCRCPPQIRLDPERQIWEVAQH